jgi:REP element-mobilizing transposase RayT
MSNWRPNFNPDHIYFVTTSAVNRKNLFDSDVIKRLIVDCLDCSRLRERLKLYDFVVMPNHIHLIIQCRADDPLASVIRDLKKHISDRIIRQFRVKGDEKALKSLSSTVSRPDKQQYKVWEKGYLAKDIFSTQFLQQKMTYIHHNPCQPHWKLVENPEEYIWSSARFYLLEEPAIIPLDNVVHILA